MDYKKFLDMSREAADNFDYDKYLADKEAGNLPKIDSSEKVKEPPREGLMRREATAGMPSPEEAQAKLGAIAERFIQLRKRRQQASGGDSGGFIGGLLGAMAGGDESPIGGEGAGGLVGGLLGAGDEIMSESKESQFGGIMQKPGKAYVPSGDTAKRIKGKLMDRGFPEHVAEAFVVNFQDESGLNPIINEREPVVKGSRGGFGLYQLTGGRRRDFEAMAKKEKYDLSSPEQMEDAQLDWVVYELDNTEKAAKKAIFGASTTADAAVAIVDKFLRPAKEHRVRRMNRYRKL